MEDSKKKSIMIGIIVVCLVAAAAITYINRPKSDRSFDNIPADATIWMKCRNPACEAVYEMNEREYNKRVQIDEDSMKARPMRCEKCGEDSAYRAEKCEKCGFVFERGTVLGDLPDRCPECGYSKMEEESRK